MKKKASLDLEQVPEELKFILKIINLDPSQFQQLSSKEEDIDWKLFLELAIHHRVYPLLYPKLKHFRYLIPDNVIQTLKIFYKRNTIEMLRLSAEMDSVNQVFSENEIRLIFLKGPVLAKDLYGDLSLRTSCDLDFLIPIEDLKKADSILINLGYEKDDYILTVLGDWKWRHHHITYIHPDKKIKLEVHWRLNPGPGKEPLFNDLWKRKRNIIFTTQPIYCLGYEDLLFFLTTHGARHGWSRLRWLIDIEQLLKQEINLNISKQLFSKYGLLHIGGQAIVLCSTLLKSNLTKEKEIMVQGKRPSKLAAKALFYLERMVNLHNDPVPGEVSDYHRRHLFSLMSNHQKLLFLFSYLFPYYTDVETMPLPKSLHILYFPLRPFLWVWRKKRNQVLP